MVPAHSADPKAMYLITLVNLRFQPDYLTGNCNLSPLFSMASSNNSHHLDRYLSHHVDFIKQFTRQETQRRTHKRPKPLSAQQRAALRGQLKEVRFLKPDYADNTKVNIAGILRKWKM